MQARVCKVCPHAHVGCVEHGVVKPAEKVVLMCRQRCAKGVLMRTLDVWSMAS